MSHSVTPLTTSTMLSATVYRSISHHWRMSVPSFFSDDDSQKQVKCSSLLFFTVGYISVQTARSRFQSVLLYRFGIFGALNVSEFRSPDARTLTGAASETELSIFGFPGPESTTEEEQTSTAMLSLSQLKRKKL